MSKDKVMEDHEYDGIQEYDNNLPKWWVWKFVLTIIFSVLYMFWLHWGGTGQSLWEEYQAARQEAELQQLAQQKQEDSLSEDQLLALVDQPTVMNSAEQTFIVNCSSCHANDGGGIVGPNLTDEYWIHGNKITDFVQIIREGVPEKGMVPWKGILTQEEIYNLAAYVESLKGTQPADPKKPEGELVAE